MSTLPPTPCDLEQLTQRLLAHCDPQWLMEPYRSQWSADNPALGFCSMASEAAWFVLGGSEAGWSPRAVRDHDGTTHWWLEHVSGLRYDPTRSQYDHVGRKPPYERGLTGRRCPFMGVRRDPTAVWPMKRRPGRRAQRLLDAMDAVPGRAPSPSRSPRGP